MSLKKNKTINKVRRKLDSLDSRLLNIIQIRTKLVDQILKKKNSKKQIVDKKRIKVILKNIKRKSLNKKIDVKLTKMIWLGMIKAYIDFEYSNIEFCY